jgi:hypothetical protein
MIERFRQSEITAWQRCRRKHNLAYTRGLVPVSIGTRQPLSGKRDAGSAAHVGVEWINNNESLEDALQAVTDWVNEVRAIRLEGTLPPLTKEDAREWWEIERLAHAITTNYTKWIGEGNEVGVTVHAVEWEWLCTLPGTSYEIYGKIDAIVYDEILGGIVVRDNKSVPDFKRTPEDADFQLRTYAWAYWRLTGIIPKRAEHLMMKRVLGTASAKPPFFERYPIQINQRILETHEGHLYARVQEMSRHRDSNLENRNLWPNATRDCSWDCDFRDLCPMIDDGSDYEYVIETDFTLKSDSE